MAWENLLFCWVWICFSFKNFFAACLFTIHLPYLLVCWMKRIFSKNIAENTNRKERRSISIDSAHKKLRKRNEVRIKMYSENVNIRIVHNKSACAVHNRVFFFIWIIKKALKMLKRNEKLCWPEKWNRKVHTCATLLHCIQMSAISLRVTGKKTFYVIHEPVNNSLVYFVTSSS